MTKHPTRIQRRRTKGWKKPDGAVIVTRPGKWGNPYTVAGARRANHGGPDAYLNDMCAELFDNAMRRRLPVVAWHLAHIGELRGKDLCCWCAPGVKCHADVLLELANIEAHHD